MFDIIVVGGGIAGLTVTESLAKRGYKIACLEKYGAWGGRIATYRDKTMQYEIGAGRIFHKHTRVNALVKRFKLHTFPIGTHTQYNGRPNSFMDLFKPICDALRKIPAHELARHTLAEIIPREFHTLFSMFPYSAELHLLRADVALDSFDKALGANNSDAFYGIVEGLDALVDNLVEYAKKAGAICKNRHRVEDIIKREDGLFEVVGDYGKKDVAKPFTFVTKKIIIAACRCSMSNFKILKPAPFLGYLATSPLIRIYAVYPQDPITGKVWFADLPKTVTPSKLRYIIPIDSNKGLIMISYTDGDDTNYWRSLDGPALQTAIQREVRREFPTLSIPNPTYLKKHDWQGGCTYWLPGEYDVASVSLAAHNPFPNIYVCGESISTEQAWIEGALQSVETLLGIFKI